MRGRFVLGCVLVAALFAGCDKPDQKTVVTTTVRSPTQPAVQTTFPTSRPASSILVIDGKPTNFPAARLLVQQAEPVIDLLVFSDDNPDVLRSRYEGNRYYFSLQRIDAPDVAQLASRDVRLRAPSMERQDTPDGIFLQGDKQHLQPYDVTVVFSQNGGDLVMDLRGQFLLFQSRPEPVAGRIVWVQGVLVAEPKMPEVPARPSGRK